MKLTEIFLIISMCGMTVVRLLFVSKFSNKMMLHLALINIIGSLQHDQP